MKETNVSPKPITWLVRTGTFVRLDNSDSVIFEDGSYPVYLGKDDVALLIAALQSAALEKWGNDTNGGKDND